jgi:hypothetical protein
MFLRTSSKIVLAVALATAAFALPARSKSADHTSRSFASLINVDALVDNYLRFVARKYNLTEELIEWGRRIQPIYLEAKGIIIQTNDEWRPILNEEQRRMHDEDVKLMYESFATTEEQLSRLTAGQMSIEEFRNPRAARQARSQSMAVQPASGVMGPAGQVGSAARQVRTTARTNPVTSARKPTARGSGSNPGSARPSSTAGAGATTAGMAGADPTASRARHRGATKGGAKTAEGQWEQYVRQFIERYQLTEEQSNRAYKILKSCENQRDRYLRSRAEQLQRLDQQEAALRTSDNPNKAKEQADITAQRTRLMAPVDNIFNKQLKPRLDKIPTRAQREAADKGKASPAGKSEAGKPPPGPRPGMHGPAQDKSQEAAQAADPPDPEETPYNPDEGDEDEGDPET